MKLKLLVLPLTVLMSTGCSSLVQDHLWHTMAVQLGLPEVSVDADALPR